MEFNIADHVSKLMNERDHNLAHHLWLEGFDKINANAILDESSVNCYIELRLSKHKPFTQLLSGIFLARNKESIENNKLKMVYLPVNDDFHLLFGLEDHYERRELFYSECGKFCRILQPYKFPLIELRRSIDFSKDEETIRTINRGMFFYDPTISIRYQTPDDIIEGYKTMKEFIKNARIN
ncbi:MAG: hypothetical protein QT11_C0001G0624 [archaeon GW2011_AR20]|nr:MAG: hypothetical protein QT11_C0001G0624 [archaeon GW2011_AR20]MBS3160895.1 hypothetical protein [Candidatus Woesearchaeota archaeon]